MKSVLINILLSKKQHHLSAISMTLPTSEEQHYFFRSNCEIDEQWIFNMLLLGYHAEIYFEKIIQSYIL